MSLLPLRYDGMTVDYLKEIAAAKGLDLKDVKSLNKEALVKKIKDFDNQHDLKGYEMFVSPDSNEGHGGQPDLIKDVIDENLGLKDLIQGNQDHIAALTEELHKSKIQQSKLADELDKSKVNPPKGESVSTEYFTGESHQDTSPPASNGHNSAHHSSSVNKAENYIHFTPEDVHKINALRKLIKHLSQLSLYAAQGKRSYFFNKLQMPEKLAMPFKNSLVFTAEILPAIENILLFLISNKVGFDEYGDVLISLLDGDNLEQFNYFRAAKLRVKDAADGTGIPVTGDIATLGLGHTDYDKLWIILLFLTRDIQLKLLVDELTMKTLNLSPKPLHNAKGEVLHILSKYQNVLGNNQTYISMFKSKFQSWYYQWNPSAPPLEGSESGQRFLAATSYSTLRQSIHMLLSASLTVPTAPNENSSSIPDAFSSGFNAMNIGSHSSRSQNYGSPNHGFQKYGSQNYGSQNYGSSVRNQKASFSKSSNCPNKNLLHNIGLNEQQKRLFNTKCNCYICLINRNQYLLEKHYGQKPNGGTKNNPHFAVLETTHAATPEATAEDAVDGAPQDPHDDSANDITVSFEPSMGDFDAQTLEAFIQEEENSAANAWEAQFNNLRPSY
ncbi:hypothetical protein BN7_3792 [Wickerhamomyces ciferrii]|uniref:Uncharacterized protein n=1 Tax=Wickerhamomyces ciferrii (strain ATCC 14091 / BCRC 22168 / CBS 111 / JCM 3599 / NBRC 0793 / NRRL Y-1031 F-60-10) TaxID=1206466 RepID=K0KMQ0_WICCF|nr:uncharacterized protein BN7_3792 [Wickerhamomyces ciferrii]CCH44231.1 hypothetical protein BN7_3792 [Wickerhamomyces ciferrii]